MINFCKIYNCKQLVIKYVNIYVFFVGYKEVVEYNINIFNKYKLKLKYIFNIMILLL